jgi:putative pyrimidine permease RutG
VGGSGVTTYAENIGVMAVTKVYSTLVFVAAAVMAMLLGFSPKFGALIHTIPSPVIGGASIVVFGLIAVAGARIWVQHRVDLSQNSNLIMVAVTLVLGAGDFALTLGGFTIGGIGTATFGAILLNALLSRRMAPRRRARCASGVVKSPCRVTARPDLYVPSEQQVVKQSLLLKQPFDRFCRKEQRMAVFTVSG